MMPAENLYHSESQKPDVQQPLNIMHEGTSIGDSSTAAGDTPAGGYRSISDYDGTLESIRSHRSETPSEFSFSRADVLKDGMLSIPQLPDPGSEESVSGFEKLKSEAGDFVKAQEDMWRRVVHGQGTLCDDGMAIAEIGFGVMAAGAIAAGGVGAMGMTGVAETAFEVGGYVGIGGGVLTIGSAVANLITDR